MYFLLLDDERKVADIFKYFKLPQVPWTIVRNYNDFCDIINSQGIPEIITYDHDLGIEAYTEGHSKKFLSFDYSNLKEKTGLDCAKFVVEKCMVLNVQHPEFYVHSMNPVGKINIEKYIEGYNKSLIKNENT